MACGVDLEHHTWENERKNSWLWVRERPEDKHRVHESYKLTR